MASLYVSEVQWSRESVLSLLPLIDCDPKNGCSRCCREARYIRVHEYEVDRIAAATGRSAERFKRKWRHGEEYRIPTPCEFLIKGKGCAIWEARPVACKYVPLQRIEHEGEIVVAVLTEWCDAGKPCIKQLIAWEEGTA